MINLQMPADGKRAMFTNKLKYISLIIFLHFNDINKIYRISSNYDNKVKTIEGMIPFSLVIFATL